jgi:hypothetical protein
MSNNERISTKKRRPSTRTIKPPVGTPPLDSDLIYPDVMFAPDGTIIPKTYTAADVNGRSIPMTLAAMTSLARSRRNSSKFMRLLALGSERPFVSRAG